MLLSQPFGLDDRCKHCHRTIREHSEEVQGAWFFFPCEGIMRKWTSEKLWDEYCDPATGLCVYCGHEFMGHWSFGPMTVQLTFNRKTATTLGQRYSPGQIVTQFPLRFSDCLEWLTDPRRA